jgi:hypothetical protein
MTRPASLHRLAALLLLGLCGCDALVDAPKQGISVRIESPPEVTTDQVFEIRTIVTNDGAKPALLDSIDIGDSYLEGVSVESSEPAWGETMHVPVDNTLSHDFQATVPAGASITVTFKARARQPGSHSGDFDICVNSVYDCFFEHIATEARAP